LPNNVDTILYNNTSELLQTHNEIYMRDMGKYATCVADVRNNFFYVPVKVKVLYNTVQ